MRQRTPRVGDIVHFYKGQGVGPLAAIIVGAAGSRQSETHGFQRRWGQVCQRANPLPPRC
jgi:hypothetical protein